MGNVLHGFPHKSHDPPSYNFPGLVVHDLFEAASRDHPSIAKTGRQNHAVGRAVEEAAEVHGRLRVEVYGYLARTAHAWGWGLGSKLGLVVDIGRQW